MKASQMSKKSLLGFFYYNRRVSILYSDEWFTATVRFSQTTHAIETLLKTTFTISILQKEALL